ncbi:HPF/RaiA family ribosome-associated protein [Noviherbaspirillum sp. CPCC 100848]|uniref:HPF/RaiA family ribosome-associated protein n=1 Tax=Noviherbaspirillum album TaxID=3080276 RepID=A0ABU6J2H7_9BURK|nr:HPF/RaiA family ribosome-associated protein [Noviherbaspirillum sp. CPCC 100848]MEC4717750.1 HPF/RaiA family ribosome-associated protein [Noviherbaspirillum sp. CPCC 100848]
MDVQILAKEYCFTPFLQEYLERSVRAAFTHTHNHVRQVAVQLREIRAERGGRENLCEVSVMLPDRPTVVIHEVQENMYTAIDYAVRRAAHRTKRMTMRKKSGSHAIAHDAAATHSEHPAHKE